jgi:histidinol-phosphate aminotransferase
MKEGSDLKTPQPRARVAEMPEYHPPLGNRDALRLDFNENTLACSPAVMAAIQKISAADLTRYPERGPVEVQVATYLGVKAEEVMLTNGVDEAIHVLCQAFLDEGDELLLPVPTYTMYEIYAAATDATLVRVPSFHGQTQDDFRYPHWRMLAAITPRTKLICIANPNSPTGAIATRDEIVKIAAAAPHAVVLVDEAYFHFYGETVIDLVGQVPNLIVARTFSKAYGLASLRIGLLAGPVELLKWVRRVLSPYSVNAMALAALTAALNDQAYLDWYVGEVMAARVEFLAALKSLGMAFWPTEANFVLVKIGEAHRQFVADMKAAGVLVRDRSADPGCDGLIRITIGTREQMQAGIAAVRASLATVQHAGEQR